MAFDIVKSSREAFSILVMLITGHNRLGYHESLLSADSEEPVSPQCRKCQIKLIMTRFSRDRAKLRPRPQRQGPVLAQCVYRLGERCVYSVPVRKHRL